MIGPRYFDLARRLYSASKFETVVDLLTEGLPDLVGASEVMVTEWSSDACLKGVWDHGPVATRMEERIETANRLSQGHPLAEMFRQMKADDLSLVVSEVSSIDAYLESSFGKEMYDGLRVSDLMAGMLVRGAYRQAYVSCYRAEGVFSAEEKSFFDAILLSVRAVMERIEGRNLDARIREMLLLTRTDSPTATFTLSPSGELLPMNHPAVGIEESYWSDDDPFLQLSDAEMVRVRRASSEAWGNPVNPKWTAVELDLGQGPVRVHLLPTLRGEGVVMYSVGGKENFEEAIKGILTKRQVEIMEWVSEGKTSAEVAIILSISPRTVEKHLEAVFQRLGVENRITAVRRYLDSKAGEA